MDMQKLARPAAVYAEMTYRLRCWHRDEHIGK